MNRSEKTDCKSVREQLDSYLDNDLKGAAAALCAAHLDQCAACRAEREQICALRRAMGSLPVPAGSDAARQRVFQNLERAARTQSAEREKRSPVLRLLGGRPAFAALSAALVVGAGLVIMMPLASRENPAENVEAAKVALPQESEMSILFQMHDAHAVASAEADGDTVFSRDGTL